MTKQDVKNYLLVTTPFVDEELHDALIDVIISDALTLFSKSIYESLTLDYSSPFADEFINSQYPTQDFTITPFTLDNINTSSNFKDFKELLTGYCFYYGSNPRRAAVIGELPMDLKGDDFKVQGEEIIAKITKILENSTKPIY